MNTKYWKQLLKSLRLAPSANAFYLDLSLSESLQALAQREKRSKDEVAADLITAGLAERQFADENIQLWQSLTRREQEIAALVCLNYNNQQIADRLVLSPETVKTHIRNILHKFDLKRKIDLHQALANWDFSAWQ